MLSSKERGPYLDVRDLYWPDEAPKPQGDEVEGGSMDDSMAWLGA